MSAILTMITGATKQAGKIMTNDLIHEVEESIKQERIEKIWKEYGSYIIGAAILAVLITVLFTGWKSWNTKINVSQTAAMIQALEQDDKAAALDQVIPGMRPNHRSLSRLTAAGLLAQDGRQDEALAHYKAAAADRDAQPIFRDLAQLMAVRLEWAMAKPNANPQALLAALEPVWKNNDSPWRFHAHEQAALILAHAQNDYVNARAHLAKITEAKDAIASLQERARNLDHLYIQKISAAAKDAPAQTTGDSAKEKPEG